MKKDATDYCTKMSQTIKDTPECKSFKDQIMSYAKGNPYAGKTTYGIISTKQKASEASCLN
jgi:hypothetical protein